MALRRPIAACAGKLPGSGDRAGRWKDRLLLSIGDERWLAADPGQGRGGESRKRTESGYREALGRRSRQIVGAGAHSGGEPEEARGTPGGARRDRPGRRRGDGERVSAERGGLRGTFVARQAVHPALVIAALLAAAALLRGVRVLPAGAGVRFLRPAGDRPGGRSEQRRAGGREAVTQHRQERQPACPPLSPSHPVRSTVRAKKMSAPSFHPGGSLQAIYCPPVPRTCYPILRITNCQFV